jgi:malate synthase
MPSRVERTNLGEGIVVRGELRDRFDAVLTPASLAFVAQLHRQFNREREALLLRRRRRALELRTGTLPDFLVETRHLREGAWTVPPAPADLQNRRVEITGPVERKMIINALNSGANVFMADFEDANAPTWANVIGGHVNLIDAVEGTITYTSPEGKVYRLGRDVATLLVRPRGWHLFDKHVEIDGEPISASLFDFGLYVFHNATRLLEKGTGPYLYLPKLESHL